MRNDLLEHRFCWRASIIFFPCQVHSIPGIRRKCRQFFWSFSPYVRKSVMTSSLVKLFVRHDLQNHSAHNKGRNGEGSRGTIPREPKSPNNVASTLFNTLHLHPKDLMFEHGAPNLLLAPGAIEPGHTPAYKETCAVVWC